MEATGVRTDKKSRGSAAATLFTGAVVVDTGAEEPNISDRMSRPLDAAGAAAAGAGVGEEGCWLVVVGPSSQSRRLASPVPLAVATVAVFISRCSNTGIRSKRESRMPVQCDEYDISTGGHDIVTIRRDIIQSVEISMKTHPPMQTTLNIPQLSAAALDRCCSDI